MSSQQPGKWHSKRRAPKYRLTSWRPGEPITLHQPSSKVGAEISICLCGNGHVWATSTLARRCRQLPPAGFRVTRSPHSSPCASPPGHPCPWAVGLHTGCCGSHAVGRAFQGYWPPLRVADKERFSRLWGTHRSPRATAKPIDCGNPVVRDRASQKRAQGSLLGIPSGAGGLLCLGHILAVVVVCVGKTSSSVGERAVLGLPLSLLFAVRSCIGVSVGLERRKFDHGRC